MGVAICACTPGGCCRWLQGAPLLFTHLITSCSLDLSTNEAVGSDQSLIWDDLLDLFLTERQPAKWTDGSANIKAMTDHNEGPSCISFTLKASTPHPHLLLFLPPLSLVL